MADTVEAAAALEPIAIIAVAGRFPGADTVETFWANLCDGIESISRFRGIDLLPAGHDPATVLHPRFVGAEGVLADPAMFAAGFFGYSPHEASIMDPQHRACLELAWEVFDSVGYDPSTVGVPTGVFVSIGLSGYLFHNLLSGDPARQRARQRHDGLHLLMHNDKDFAASTVSYRLGLTGPSYAVGSACSSSLVAVHLAARSLLTQECDLALAGGAFVQVPHGQGYVHTDDGIYSRQGRCAAFDADADGTVGGSGAALVLLKRLSDARRDGDNIHATILGSAVNNDGARKIGYSAPGAAGQAEVIIEAQAVAGAPPDSIGYVEAHGTGTRLGDAVELAALTEAFRAGTGRRQFCRLGSVKSNVGHLDAAAGVAGLVKAAFAVRDGIVPASLHYRRPDPTVDLDATPFSIATETAAWPAGSEPRRAGVSSFGIGGTNAHVVLEQPPEPPPRQRVLRPDQALVVSADTPRAVRTAAAALARHLRDHPKLDLADVAATLARRRALPYRRAVVARDIAEAARLLDEETAEPDEALSGRPLVFAFPAHASGGPYPLPGEPAFRGHLDECTGLLSTAGFDLAVALRTPVVGRAAGPVLFSLGYALARTLLGWGIEPTAVIGCGVGEHAAGVIAGTVSLSDALELVLAGTGRGSDEFGADLGRCLELGPVVVLDLAPASGLDEMVRAHPAFGSAHRVVRAPTGSLASLVGQVWVAGCAVDWAEIHRPQAPRRVALPSQRLDRQRYWIDPPVAPVPFPRLADLSAGLRSDPAVPEPTVGIDDYPGLRAGLNGFCAELARWYLTRSGLDTGAGRSHEVADVVRRLGVLPPFARLVDALFDMLVEDGLAVRHGTQVRFCPGSVPVDRARVDASAARLIRDYPPFAGLVELLVHCVDGYPTALSRPGEALRVLYPDGRSDLLTRSLSERTVEHRAVGGLVGSAARLLERLAEGLSRPIRVLEVGAGEGGLTQALAGRLPPGRLSYHATDISPAFLGRLAAEADRRGMDWLRTRVFDIGQVPAGQGLAGHRYDLICGLDVLHAAPDIRRGLGHLRSLLAPGGVLALIETTAADRWLTLIWGLSDGWWGYTDDRQGGPLLDPVRWRALVEEQGFAAMDVIMLEPGPRDAALVLAQQPGPTVPTLSPSDSLLARAWPAKRPDLATWCYRPGWRQTGPARRSAPVDGGTCLLFSGGPLGVEVARRLADLGVGVVSVATAPAGPPGHRVLDPSDPEGYGGLVRELAAAGRPVRLVVHLWALEESMARGTAAGPATIGAAEAHGLHSLLHIARALGGLDQRETVRLVAVTGAAQDVLGDDTAHPEQATVAAAVKVIPREYPWIACTAVDVLPRHTRPGEIGQTAGWVRDELLGARESAVVAYRGRRRHTPDYLPYPLAADPDAPVVRPRSGGVYLVCGGLGAIGMSLAEWLGRTPARVVLTSRRSFPAESEWDSYRDRTAGDPVGVAVRRLRDLRMAGAEVMVRRADITDLPRMRAVVAEAERRFGPLTGVVHAAGMPDTAGMIHRRTAADTDVVTAAKTRGVLVLDEAVGDRSLDFFVLCSSIGTILHKLKFGEVGYVAGNEFLDAFAGYRAVRRPGTTIAIAWSDWLDEGMWADAQRRLRQRYTAGNAAADLLGGLTRAEGVEVCARVLAHGVAPRAVVSTVDLDELLARHVTFSPADHLAAVGMLRVATDATDRVPERSAGLGPVGRTVARFWSSLLGVTEVRATDDFFELGGDSLLALRLLAMLQEEFGVDVPMARLFDRPTPAGIAELVEQARAVPARGEHEEVVL